MIRYVIGSLNRWDSHSGLGFTSLIQDTDAITPSRPGSDGGQKNLKIVSNELVN